MVSYLVKMALARGIIHCNKTSHHVLRVTVRKYCDLGVTQLGKKILSKVGSKSESYQLPVETNTHTLASYVCGTKLYEESGENIKIKPDSEYPKWLFTMHTGAPKELHELDPNSLEYWKTVRILGMQTKRSLDKLLSEKRDYK